MQTLLQSLQRFAARLGADARDDDDVRLRKTLLVVGAFMFIVAGALWGLVYFAFGEWLAGAIPFSYSVVSLLSVVVFALTRRYEWLRDSQLAFILVLPFLLMTSLGGFIPSSGVILWSLICPLGALLFAEPRQAPWWFAAYVGLVVLSGFLQPHLRVSNALSPTMVTVFFVMNIGVVSAIVFVLLHHFVRQTHAERQKSEALLLNILPREVVPILKHEPRTIADHFAGASVLFADVVGFTPMSATMSPVDTVELLNEVFSHFDVLAERHGLEKIKTIGDCYMVAAGVPRPRADHAHALTHMALEMRDYVRERTFRGGTRLAFRIGMDSGPVVAGVIGRKKFIYDLWGDAVNTASRMESHGASGEIQITRATYELIKDDFVCEPQGTVVVKGKGEMEVWYAVRARG